MQSMKYIEKLKSIQQNLLVYIDDDSEDQFNNIKDILQKNKIEDNQYELKSFLYLLSKIFKNNHRVVNFFNKIERILEYLKDDILKCFSNAELFHIFKSNKRILLFLVESKIMIIDKYIVKRIIKGKFIKAKYPHYFQPEIEPFIYKKWFPMYEIGRENNWIFEIIKEKTEDFYEQRKIGENDHFICELIQKDSVDDFIVYMNQNNYQFNSTIKPSIYETNNFLLKKEIQNQIPTLIEYAVFCGSIQIFNYLRFSGVDLTPSLWFYAIHGKNSEIIHLLEENHLKPKNQSYEQIFKESIKCHHNDIAEYIQNIFLVNKNIEDSNYEIVNGLKYYNFKFIKNEQINGTTFNYLCKYDYYTLVSVLLNTMDIDINHKTI